MPLTNLLCFSPSPFCTPPPPLALPAVRRLPSLPVPSSFLSDSTRPRQSIFSVPSYQLVLLRLLSSSVLPPRSPTCLLPAARRAAPQSTCVPPQIVQARIAIDNRSPPPRPTKLSECFLSPLLPIMFPPCSPSYQFVRFFPAPLLHIPLLTLLPAHRHAPP